MDEREQRGVQLALTNRIRQQGESWTVPSQSGDGSRYTVRLGDAPRCTCPDHTLRKRTCKHIYAVEYTRTHETYDDGTETITEKVRVSYAQEWRTYNQAQTEEGE